VTPRKYTGPCALLFRATFFGCIVLCVALAWLPSSVMIRSGVGGRIEHAAAYLGLAIIMSLAHRDRPRLLIQFLFLIAVAAILELGQLYSSDRQSSFLDFAASCTGAAIGGLLMWLVRARILNYLGLAGPDAEGFRTIPDTGKLPARRVLKRLHRNRPKAFGG